MKTVLIATDLKTDETNIDATKSELEKIVKLTKGEFYVWVGTWITWGEYTDSNSIEDLFAV